MTWEYKVMEIGKFQHMKNLNELQQTLNDYGLEGWELVGILQQENSGWVPKAYDDVVTFKRPLVN